MDHTVFHPDAATSPSPTHALDSTTPKSAPILPLAWQQVRGQATRTKGINSCSAIVYSIDIDKIIE